MIGTPEAGLLLFLFCGLTCHSLLLFSSNFMAFISNKAISNRKKFAKQLRDTAAVTEFDSLKFLTAIHSVLSHMNSPCLRLELLQYILGLDNRYSVAHVTRAVELAATCLNLSESDVFNDEERELLGLEDVNR